MLNGNVPPIEKHPLTRVHGFPNIYFVTPPRVLIQIFHGKRSSFSYIPADLSQMLPIEQLPERGARSAKTGRRKKRIADRFRKGDVTFNGAFRFHLTAVFPKKMKNTLLSFQFFLSGGEQAGRIVKLKPLVRSYRKAGETLALASDPANRYSAANRGLEPRTPARSRLHRHIFWLRGNCL